jgi:hypothetical protein
MKTSKETAVEALEFNLHFNEMHITSDNVPFINIDDAKYHASKLDNPTVDSFTRDELFGAVEENFVIPSKEDELIAFVSDQVDLELLASIKGSGEYRPTVLAAIDARVAELEALKS